MIQHYFIEDLDYSGEDENELVAEMYETSNVTFTYNAGVVEYNSR